MKNPRGVVLTKVGVWLEGVFTIGAGLLQILELFDNLLDGEFTMHFVVSCADVHSARSLLFFTDH